MNPYSAVCHHVLVAGEDHHPNYLAEKAYIATMSHTDAFAHLDYHNMKKAIDYCVKWNYEVPGEWQVEYDLQVAAARELGFEL